MGFIWIPCHWPNHVIARNPIPHLWNGGLSMKWGHGSTQDYSKDSKQCWIDHNGMHQWYSETMLWSPRKQPQRRKVSSEACQVMRVCQATRAFDLHNTVTQIIGGSWKLEQLILFLIILLFYIKWTVCLVFLISGFLLNIMILSHLYSSFIFLILNTVHLVNIPEYIYPSYSWWWFG